MDVLVDMKTTIILLFALFSYTCTSQELFNVSGTIGLVSYHQGGVELPPVMMEPHPLVNTKLFVVQYYGPEEKTKIVATVISDEYGKYEVKLPPGKYGFVQHKSEVDKGIYLPGMKVKEDNDSTDVVEFIWTEVGHEDYWSLSTVGPFEVSSNDLIGVDITHFDVTICYTCP